MNMNLEQAIEWANIMSDDNLVYNVVPWNDGYCVVRDNGKISEHKSVYNTMNKNYNILENKFFTFSSKEVEKAVLESDHINSTYICKIEHKGGPKLGTILKPHYNTLHDCEYKFMDRDGVSKSYNSNKMGRMFVYYNIKHDPNLIYNLQKNENIINRKTRLQRMVRKRKLFPKKVQ